MNKTDISERIDHHRRRFFGAAALTVAAAQLGVIGAADAQSDGTKPTPLPAIKPGTNTSFGPLKQIDAGVLNIGYAETGPADGPPVEDAGESTVALLSALHEVFGARADTGVRPRRRAFSTKW